MDTLKGIYNIKMINIKPKKSFNGYIATATEREWNNTTLLRFKHQIKSNHNDESEPTMTDSRREKKNRTMDASFRRISIIEMHRPYALQSSRTSTLVDVEEMSDSMFPCTN
ncbi:hypothetical protein V1477_017940 [Vespula maculifrons]|uniref:Uncharacterized protein n=1 Tax=Vespula maculifrons TaxID=7453 RepID=A0ABD2B0J2_VESMC